MYMTHLSITSSAFNNLTKLSKEICHKVVEGGGIVRGIQNHGTRQLPHRFKARHVDMEGNRYYKKGRFFSIYYDSNPSIMQEVESMIFLNEDILRKTHLKVRDERLFDINLSNEKKNQYIQKALLE